MPEWVKFICGGLALLVSSGLIQFLIQRYDTKHDKYLELNKKIEEGLEERERTGYERYMEHKEAIEELRGLMTEFIKAETKQNIDQDTIIHANAELLVALAQSSIVSVTEKYMERGAITLDELAVLDEIYEPYHNKLGGNGRGKAGIEKCHQLPVVSDEVARLKDKVLRNVV